MENEALKHRENASEGWYRYDTYFAVSVKGSNEKQERLNQFRATLIVRKTLKGLFLYGLIDIKKERVCRLSLYRPYGRKTAPFYMRIHKKMCFVKMDI